MLNIKKDIAIFSLTPVCQNSFSSPVLFGPLLSTATVASSGTATGVLPWTWWCGGFLRDIPTFVQMIFEDHLGTLDWVPPPPRFSPANSSFLRRAGRDFWNCST